MMAFSTARPTSSARTVMSPWPWYIAETAVRETREESGIDVEVTGIVGIYTNPNLTIEEL